MAPNKFKSNLVIIKVIIKFLVELGPVVMCPLIFQVKAFYINKLVMCPLIFCVKDFYLKK